MRLHERHDPTTRAEIEVRECVARVSEKYKLTYGELFHMLAAVTLSWATGAVREERNERAPGT